MDLFAMPELTVEGKVLDCVILVIHRHSRYIMAVPGKNARRRTKGTRTEWGWEPRQ